MVNEAKNDPPVNPQGNLCLQWIKAGSVEGQILSADLAAELGVGFWCKTQVESLLAEQPWFTTIVQGIFCRANNLCLQQQNTFAPFFFTQLPSFPHPNRIPDILFLTIEWQKREGLHRPEAGAASSWLPVGPLRPVLSRTHLKKVLTFCCFNRSSLCYDALL